VLFDELIPYWKGKTVRDAKIAAFRSHDLSSQLDLSPREIHRKLRSFGVRRAGPVGRGGAARRHLHRSVLAGQTARGEAAAAAARRCGRRRRQPQRARTLAPTPRRTSCWATRTILGLGFSGIPRAGRLAAGARQTEGESAFLQSVELSCEAMRAFSERFVALARVEAAATPDPERRTELEAIAERCSRVPWLPPRNFAEAVQALWFTQNAAIISYGAGSGITPGRVDQLLFPTSSSPTYRTAC